MLRFARPSTAALLAALVTAACGGDAPVAPRAAQPPKAETIEIRGPTVVAFFAITQPEVDADGDAMEALADFQVYLPGQEAFLRALGVRLVHTYADTLRIVHDGRTDVVLPRTLPASVGYLFFAPGKPRGMEAGVMTDVDVDVVARRYYGFPPNPAYAAP